MSFLIDRGRTFKLNLFRKLIHTKLNASLFHILFFIDRGRTFNLNLFIKCIHTELIISVFQRLM